MDMARPPSLLPSLHSAEGSHVEGCWGGDTIQFFNDVEEAISRKDQGEQSQSSLGWLRELFRYILQFTSVKTCLSSLSSQFSVHSVWVLNLSPHGRGAFHTGAIQRPRQYLSYDPPLDTRQIRDVPLHMLGDYSRHSELENLPLTLGTSL